MLGRVYWDAGHEGIDHDHLPPDVVILKHA